MGVQRCYVATAADEGKRLDSLLADAGLYASRSAAAKAVERGLVLVAGKPATKKQQVSAGQAVVYELEDAPVASLEGEPIDLDIRYEDQDLIVLSKQVGLVCHPSGDHLDGTLVNALIHHCGIQNLCKVQGEEDDRRGIVHRLDMNTSGLMLAAKSNEAGYILMDDIRARVVDRHYLALVHGIVAHDSGMIDAPITRSTSDRKRMAVKDVPQARNAVTTFRVLERFDAGPKDDGFTLVDCKLFTGRTHQIRVHMEYAKHPLVGDPVYTSNGPKTASAQLGLERQFLHSYKLGLDHPITQEHLEFADNLPADLQEALDSLAGRSRGRTEAGEQVFALLAESPVPCVQGTVNYS